MAVSRFWVCTTCSEAVIAFPGRVEEERVIEEPSQPACLASRPTGSQRRRAREKTR
jgi:hypothetical protein